MYSTSGTRISVLPICTRTVERVLGAKHVNRMFNHRIAVMLGFKQFRNAAITIAGIELMDRI